jgi:hypothetical protein
MFLNCHSLKITTTDLPMLDDDKIICCANKKSCLLLSKIKLCTTLTIVYSADVDFKTQNGHVLIATCFSKNQNYSLNSSNLIWVKFG